MSCKNYLTDDKISWKNIVTAHKIRDNSYSHTKLARSVYLATYSQANKEEIPTRAFFAQALVKSFEHAGA